MNNTSSVYAQPSSSPPHRPAAPAHSTAPDARCQDTAMALPPVPDSRLQVLESIAPKNQSSATYRSAVDREAEVQCAFRTICDELGDDDIAVPLPTSGDTKVMVIQVVDEEEQVGRADKLNKLARNSNWLVRSAAMFLGGDHWECDMEAFQSCLWRGLHDSHPIVRAQAVTSCDDDLRRGTPRIREKLLEMLGTDPESEVRIAACMVLEMADGHLSDEPCAGAVRGYRARCAGAELQSLVALDEAKKEISTRQSQDESEDDIRHLLPGQWDERIRRLIDLLEPIYGP